MSLKRTPLFDAHVALGAKMVPFAGWEMPVQYEGILSEHIAVRNGAGLFDVSHMGQIEVKGLEAEQAINYLTCNDVSLIEDGRAQYSAFLNENGGIVDDLIVHRNSPNNYLLCVNASNLEKDYQWLIKNNKFDAEIKNSSDDYAQLALQGPGAAKALSEALGFELSSIKRFAFSESVFFDEKVLIARTGYTGEDGCELYIPEAAATKFWDALVSLESVVPCGLGARDTLRLEACYPLHGHEISDSINPLEAKLNWIVRLGSGDFIGREALLQIKESGISRKLIGFKVEGRGIVRDGAELFDEAGDLIGFVTSGTKTPSFEKPIGMALVAKGSAKVGSNITARVRGRDVQLLVIKLPHYKGI